MARHTGIEGLVSGNLAPEFNCNVTFQWFGAVCVQVHSGWGEFFTASELLTAASPSPKCNTGNLPPYRFRVIAKYWVNLGGRMRRFFATAPLVVILGAIGAVAQVNPVPLVYQPLIPASVAPGRASFTLTVNGTGFASGAVVNWNGSPRLTEVMSSSQLKASINASDVSTAQTGWVTVTNPAPRGGTSNTVYLPVRKPSASVGMAITQPFPNATFVAAGDFNNDGKLDVGWYGNGSFNVSLGNGKGGFQAPILNANVFGEQFVVGDFNNDGKLDVAAAVSGNEVALWLGNGDGTFTLAWEYFPVFGGCCIAAADFSQDGQMTFYNTGHDLGSQWFDFVCGQYCVSALYYTSYFTGTAVFGDFNGDGTLDLAIPELGSGPTHILLYSGGNYNEVGTVPVSGPTIVADMNRDGKLDLNSDCIWLGAGNGNFSEAGCPGIGNAYTAGIGDFNGDGKLDSVMNVDAYPAGGAAVVLGKGDGTYGNAFQFPLPAYGPGLGTVGDFNNDGKLDFVTADGHLFIQTTVDLTPVSLAFGNQNVGTTSAAQNATLTNVGTTPLTITKIGITGTNASQFAQTNNCGLSLAAGANCTIAVTFAPKKGGSLAATLYVIYKGTASPQTVALTGTGITPPTVSLLPTSLQFATQLVGTKSPSQAAILANTGDLDVTISNIAITGAFSQTNDCPSTLVIGSSCTITIVFAPTVAGTVSGTLSVTDNALKSPQKVLLTGVGTVITVSPTSINFGDQKVGTTSSAAPVTLSNVGSAAVAITAISIAGTNAGDFAETNNCGTTLAGKSSCTIKVTFTPTATGARSASLSITDNGGGSPQSVSLAGTGT